MKSRLKPQLNLVNILFAFFRKNNNSIIMFEKEFSKKFECDFGVMFSHGRTGLFSLLKIWGLENDEVICPAYTCVVVPNAIVLSGNNPVFVDCSKDSFNMCIAQLEKTINSKTRAIIVTHLFGYPMNVVKVQKIVASKEKKYGHKIYIIQDVAHSFGAKWNGELVTKFGDAAFFGLNVSKILTTIFGGMVITNDKENFEKLKKFRETNFRKETFKNIKRLMYAIASNIAFRPIAYGFVNLLETKGLIDTFTKYYKEEVIDFPKDWDVLPCPYEAEVGRSQIKLYDSIIHQRKKITFKWQKTQSKKNGIKFFENIEGSTFSHCVALVDKREEWLEDFRSNYGTQLGELIEYSIPHMKSYKKFAQQKEFPNALFFSKKTINFPNYPKYKFNL